MPKIGGQIYEHRRRRNLTVRELAARSGVSHSTISLIERDKMSPSIDTLGAILDALGLTLAGFFSGHDTGQRYSPFYRSEDLVEIGRIDAISYRVVGFDFPHRNMMVLHERYKPGTSTGNLFSHVAQEAGIVISGAVEVTVGDQSRVLEPGDSYYFDSRIPHAFKNVGNEESEIFSAISPPTY
jgi:transcriptional regulator with XRE-family HTH domain